MEENEIAEFKKSLDEESIICTMVAFANHKGGKIFVGIMDDGAVVGINIGKHKLEQFTKKVHDEAKPAIFFETNFEAIDGKEILIIKVQEAKRKPVFYKGTVYKRINKTTLKVADPDEVRALFIHKTIFFDDNVCEGALFEDIDDESVESFAKMASLSGRLPTMSSSTGDTLQKLGLVDGKKIKNGAIMLFGKQPSKFFATWGIRCAVVSNNLEFMVMQDYDQNIFTAIEKAMEFVNIHLKKDIKIIGLRRMETPSIPSGVVREAIVNAVAHRDYFFPSFTYIAIYPKYLEIKNPGKLEAITVDELSQVHSSIIKNPHIAHTLYLAGYIEKWGVGTLKMISGMREQSLSDPLFTSNSMFSVKLMMEKEELTGRQKFILSYLKKSEKMKPIELKEKFGLSLTSAVKDFQRLVKLGLITKKGMGKNSHYFLTKPY